MSVFLHIAVVDETSERQIVQSHQLAPRASSATKELDDLMASLSDFKVRVIAHHKSTHSRVRRGGSTLTSCRFRCGVN